MEFLLTGVIPTQFIEDDGGRVKSKRSRQRNDCTVRALAIATETDYDTVYDFIAEQGRKCGRGFHLQKLLNKYSKNGSTIFGKKVVKHSFQAEKGRERMYVAAFCVLHPKGRFITRQAGHVAAVIDGYVHDTNLISCDFERCVYTAFELI